MKHNVPVTAFLIAMFVLSQLVGLFLINHDLEVKEIIVENQTVNVADYSQTAIGERPMLSGVQTFIYIGFAVLFGTILLLILIKFKQRRIWKTWFTIAVWLTITISLDVILDTKLAYFLGFIFAIWKIFKPNIIVHNLTEVLMYSGIAILFVPLLDVFWAIILLIAISLYDMYAVWHSKHMVKMAQFQTKSGVFAGLSVDYTPKKEKINEKEIKHSKDVVIKKVKVQRKQAILGGGDVAFPMLFSGAIMQWLIVDKSIGKLFALLQANIITLFVAIALTLLFVFAKKDRFYPAMPFVTGGAFLGYIIILIIGLF